MRTKHIKSMALLLPLLVGVSGCGTLFTSSTESITIRSNEPQAKISVNGNEIGKGQAVAVIPNGKQAIITASAPGCSDRSTPTGTAFNTISVLNLLSPLAWLIDVASGSIHVTEPTTYTVTPDCSARGK